MSITKEAHITICVCRPKMKNEYEKIDPYIRDMDFSHG
jgi:hypothetical protein